jgi:hypothetical protein
MISLCCAVLLPQDGLLSYSMRELANIPDDNPKWILLDGALSLRLRSCCMYVAKHQRLRKASTRICMCDMVSG